jgi:hypothetical protein
MERDSHQHQAATGEWLARWATVVSEIYRDFPLVLQQFTGEVKYLSRQVIARSLVSMVPESSSGSALAAPVGTTVPNADAVREALNAILESKHFRTSKQCQELLRYIVEHSLGAENASLKERIIGAEVFGRALSYDTAEDPVVRVRAADVRKRLAQYYQSCEHPLLHIELQPGSYRASFRLEQPLAGRPLEVTAAPSEPVPAKASSRRRLLSWPWITAVLLLIAVAVPLCWFVWASKSSQQLFWAPLTKANQPILVYLGSNAAYIFTPDYMARYRATHGITQNGPEFFVTLPPDSSILAGDLSPVPDTFVTVGDLAATVAMAAMMNRWKQPFMLRSGRDVAFGDLRNRPAVLIGGFNNPWTLKVTSGLPFSLWDGTRIAESNHPEHNWSVTPANSSTDDYALISRLLHSKTGGPVVTVAGIGESGTQAAAEFLSNPTEMKELFRSAPRNWQNQNVQIVLHVKVVDHAPVNVDVVATRYW